MAAAVSRHGFDWRVPRFLYVLYVSFYVWVYVHYVCMYIGSTYMWFCNISHTYAHTYKLSCVHTYIHIYRRIRMLLCLHVCVHLYGYDWSWEIFYPINIGCMYCGGSGYYMSPVDFIRNPLLWIIAISHYKVWYPV